jgi:D-3-phosphoglycerate dehydrogenase
MDELLGAADVVTMHVPALPTTKGMVNKAFLAKMKKTATLVNTSRADIVVEKDILEHLKENKNFRYAADVFAGEPAEKTGSITNELAKHPQTYGTHHIGASTAQAEEAVGDEAVRMIAEFSKGKELPNCVNVAELKAATPKPRL